MNINLAASKNDGEILMTKIIVEGTIVSPLSQRQPVSTAIRSIAMPLLAEQLLPTTPAMPTVVVAAVHSEVKRDV
jgi:hypothetical protein